MKIKGNEYNLKYTFRAMMLFEQITKKPFSIDSLSDELILFYSVIMASNSEANLSFDDFINDIDEDPSLLKDFTDFLNNEAEKRNTYTESTKEDSKKKF
jgi:hypothetical protein